MEVYCGQDFAFDYSFSSSVMSSLNIFIREGATFALKKEFFLGGLSHFIEINLLFILISYT